jgi:GTP pyrophosphokinase
VQRALRSTPGFTHNVAVPERTQTAPPLTGRFAAGFALAWAVHGTQMRKKTGIPYMAHVMTVCALALENGADEDVAIAALLHDAVEDSDDGEVTHRVIEDQFGERVARIVMACSDAVAVPGRPKPDWRERKETYLRHLEADADADVLLVSACDKVHNTRSILSDLRIEGDVVWQRFTVPDPEAQLWYYTSVLEILQRRLPGPLTDELACTVKEIAALVS